MLLRTQDASLKEGFHNKYNTKSMTLPEMIINKIIYHFV